jgi:hypothetical protein
VPNSEAYFCDCSGTGRSGIDCGTGDSKSTAPASNSSSPATTTGAGTVSCPVPCNNGECTPNFNSDTYYCKCKAGSDPNASGCSAAAPAASPPATATTCPVECVNGQCLQVMNSDSYYCSCISGFSGPACKVSTTAATAPTTAAASTGTPTCPVSCKHGQCLQQFNSDTYYCNCTTGFTGPDCGSGSAAADSPTAAVKAADTTGCSIDCKRGTCKPVLNSYEYYCECPTGYTGWDCGVTTGSASGATSSGDSQQHGARTLEGWKIFVIVLAALVGSIMAASVAYIFWRKRRGPATFVKFTDGDMEGQQEIEIKRMASSTS